MDSMDITKMFHQTLVEAGELDKLIDNVDKNATAAFTSFSSHINRYINGTSLSIARATSSVNSIILSAQNELAASLKDNSTNIKIVDMSKIESELNAAIASTSSAYDKMVMNGQLAEIELLKVSQQAAIDNVKIARDAAGEFSDSLFSIFDKLPGGGLLQKAMGLDKLKDTFRVSLTNNFKSMLNEYETTGKISFGNISAVAKKSFGMIGQSIGNLLLNPVTLLVLLVVAAIQRFFELDAAAAEFRKNTGVTLDQMGQMAVDVKTISREYSNFGIKAADVYKSASALVGELDNASLVSGDLLKKSSLLSKNLGVTEESSAKVMGIYSQMSNLTNEQAMNLGASTALLAKAGGVAPRQVMNDIANASETTFTMMRGNSKEMAKTAVEARRLGTNIESVAKSARGMLNFQDSMNAEMEASVLIGKKISFQSARQAAFNGDIMKSRELALAQVEKIGDFTKMNVFQQEALAKAAGMTVPEMTKQLQRKKQLAELEKKNPELAKKYREQLEKIDKGQEYSLERELKEQAMQSQKEKMLNGIYAIWESISDILVPLIEMVVNVFVPVLQIIGSLIKGFLTPFSKLFENMFKTKDAASGIASCMASILPYIELIGEGIGYFASSLLWAMTMFGQIGSVITPIISMIMRIGIYLMQFGEIGMTIGNVITNFGWAFSGVAKFVPVIGWIILGIQSISKYVTDMFDVWNDGTMGIGEKLMRTLYGIPKAILKAIWSPFEMALDWISGLFGGPKIGSWVTSIIDGFYDGLAKLQGMVLDFFINLWKNILGGFEKSPVCGHSPSEIGWSILTGIVSIGESLISAVLEPFKAAGNMVMSFFDGEGNIGDKLIEGIKSVASSLFDIISFPFRKVTDFVGGLFGIENLGETIIDGIKSMAGKVFTFLTMPYRKVLNFISNLFKTDFSKGIVNGIKSVGSQIFEFLSSPFRKAWAWISDLFVGHSPSKLASGIVDGISAVATSLFDLITLPFRKAWEWISNSFIGKIAEKMFGGMSSSSKKAEESITAPMKSAKTFMESMKVGEIDAMTLGVYNLTSAITLLSEAISKLPEIKLGDLKALNDLPKLDTLSVKANVKDVEVDKKQKTTTETSNSDVLVAKFDELISLMKAGGIGVYLDKKKVSEALTTTVY